MSDNEYNVEAIRTWRYNLRKKRKEYLVKWVGYREEENTWEPKSHLTNCPKILKDFIDSLEGEQLAFHETNKPEKLTGFQRNATFVKCVGADDGHASDDESTNKLKKQKRYCLCSFDDTDAIEEVTIKEFHTYQPEKTFEFFEERILRKHYVS